MKYQLEKSLEILERTPQVLKTLLAELSEEWLVNNEGINTWSPYDVIGHLIHGEKTDWIPRAKIILEQKEPITFSPFDRFAQFGESKGKTIKELLNEFEQLRLKNIHTLKSFPINGQTLGLTGKHPELGVVTLSQLLATWVTHDLVHIAQIARVMAKQYGEEIGPWRAYIGFFNK